MENIVIRQGTVADIPAMSTIDMAANEDFPVLTIPWKNLSDCHDMLVHRYTFLFHDPAYHFLVAVVPEEGKGEEVVGFLVWREKQKEGAEEWKPELAEGTDLEFIGYVMNLRETDPGKLALKPGDITELESFSISPKWQRLGLGGKMLASVLTEVDKLGEKMYISATEVGKGLYEKFGFKEASKRILDLSRWGKEPYTTWNIIRDAK